MRLCIVIVVVILLLVGCNRAEDLVEGWPDSTKLPYEYTSEMAVENGDVVNIHGTIINIEMLDEFILKFNNSEEAYIRVVQYTVEGDPIIYWLLYDLKEITLYKDTTRDEYGAKHVRTSKFNSISKVENDESIDYRLLKSDSTYELLLKMQKSQ